MDLQLKGKTALVTGASSDGLGRAIAQGLAAEGVKLCITSRRRPLLEEVAAGIVAAGGHEPAIVVADIMKEDAVSQITSEAVKKIGPIDILINCAGIGSPQIAIEGPDAEWIQMMTINFDRVRQLTHALLPSMIERCWGRIINISGKSENKGMLATPSAKAAVHAWSKGVSNLVGKHGITCNSVAPGRILTEQLRRKYTEEWRAEESARDIPMGRYGEPDELACLAVFLASPRAGYITGTVMPVDGGLRRYAF